MNISAGSEPDAAGTTIDGFRAVYIKAVLVGPELGSTAGSNCDIR